MNVLNTYYYDVAKVAKIPETKDHFLRKNAHPRPRWRWAVPLRLRPLRMTDLSAGECLVRLTGRADTPHTRLLRSFPFRTALRCVIDSASPAVQGGLLTAGSGTHPARCTGIGLVLRPQPDPDVPQARCSSRWMPRNAVAHLGTLADFALLGLHCFHCTAQCAHFVRGYRRCSPWTHSCRCRRSTLPCLRFHRTSTSPEHKIQPREYSRPDFENNFSRKRQKFQKKR